MSSMQICSQDGTQHLWISIIRLVARSSPSFVDNVPDYAKLLPRNRYKYSAAVRWRVAGQLVQKCIRELPPKSAQF